MIKISSEISKEENVEIKINNLISIIRRSVENYSKENKNFNFTISVKEENGNININLS